MNENINSYDLTDFQNNLLAGNYEQCAEFVKTVLNKEVDIKQLYDSILKKSLYNVGEMWEEGKISVATEHLATAIIETILSEVYENILPEKKIDKTAVLACTENEFHQIGIKMVSDVFEQNGWQVHFTGATTTTEELLSLIESVQPDIVGLTLSIPYNLPTLEKMLARIRGQFPKLDILIGGQAFRHIDVEVLQKFGNIIYKANLNDLHEYLTIEWKGRT